MAVNFGRSVHSNSGLDVDVDGVDSTVVDMARDEEVRGGREDEADREVFDDDDEWRMEFLAAAVEKARIGEALREAKTVKANAMGDTFIISPVRFVGVLRFLGCDLGGIVNPSSKPVEDFVDGRMRMNAHTIFFHCCVIFLRVVVC
jgi:hypothetical protein